MCHYWVAYNIYVRIRPFPMIWLSSLAVFSQQGSGSRRTRASTDVRFHVTGRDRWQRSHSTYPGDGSSSYSSLTLQKVNVFHFLLLNFWGFSCFLFYIGVFRQRDESWLVLTTALCISRSQTQPSPSYNLCRYWAKGHSIYLYLPAYMAA